MTENNTHLDPIHIQDLEKKYMSKINEVIHGEDFLKGLKVMEKLIKIRFTTLEKLYPITQFYNHGFERIVKYSIPKVFAKYPYPNPATSDLAFYPEDADCILNIDTKVVNENQASNLIDKDTCVASENQTTLSHVATDEENKIEGFDFAGVDYKSKLLKHDYHYDENKLLPILTYIIKCVYDCDHKVNKTFDLKRLDLTCIPHHEVFRYNWPDEDCIFPNVKIYGKINEMRGFKKLSDKIKRKYTPIKEDEFDQSNKIQFNKIYGNSNKEFFLDKELKHPLRDKEKHIAWAYADLTKKYYAVDNIKTPRLTIKKDRFDSDNNSWLGHIEKNLSSSS